MMMGPGLFTPTSHLSIPGLFVSRAPIPPERRSRDIVLRCVCHHPFWDTGLLCSEPIAQMDNVSGHTSNTSRHIWNTCGPRLIRFLGVCSTNSPNTRWGQSDTPDTHKHILAQVLINERSCGVASAPGAPLVLLCPTSISPRHPPCPLCLHFTQVPGHQTRSMWIHVCTPRSTP